MKKSTLSLLIILASVSLAECKENGNAQTKNDNRKDAMVVKTPEKSKASCSNTLKYLASGAVGVTIGALLVLFFGRPLMAKEVAKLETLLNVTKQELAKVKAEAPTKLDKANLQQFYAKMLSSTGARLYLVQRDGQPRNEDRQLLSYFFHGNNEISLNNGNNEMERSIKQGDIIKCTFIGGLRTVTTETCYLKVVEVKKNKTCTGALMEKNLFSYQFESVEDPTASQPVAAAAPAR